jgi:lipoprotein-anchoring transpeptidase ErfK/SrfK
MFSSTISRITMGASIAATAALLTGGAYAQSLNFAPAQPTFPASIFSNAMPQDQQSYPMEETTAPQEQSDAALPERLRRQIVDYRSNEAPGTIVIDTPHTYLYYVLGGGKAMRYGIGVGREGFTWSGVRTVGRKAEWPDWIPPEEMLERQPYLPRWMAGGPANPLGARAMYLAGTMYRIHGTNAPSTIGQHVSSGCIRMLNADVIDLYQRVKVGTKVVVLPDHGGTVHTAAHRAPHRTHTSQLTRVY